MFKRIALWADSRMDELVAIEAARATMEDTFLGSTYGPGLATVNPWRRMRRRAARRAVSAAALLDVVTLGGLISSKVYADFRFVASDYRQPPGTTIQDGKEDTPWC